MRVSESLDRTAIMYREWAEKLAYLTCAKTAPYAALISEETHISYGVLRTDYCIALLVAIVHAWHGRLPSLRDIAPAQILQSLLHGAWSLVKSELALLAERKSAAETET